MSKFSRGCSWPSNGFAFNVPLRYRFSSIPISVFAFTHCFSLSQHTFPLFLPLSPYVFFPPCFSLHFFLCLLLLFLIAVRFNSLLSGASLPFFFLFFNFLLLPYHFSIVNTITGNLFVCFFCCIMYLQVLF